jgi:Protein of unknown function (DUF620)
MESIIDDYRPVDGINITHSSGSTISLLRYGDTTKGNTRIRMEEVDFNIRGLSKDTKQDALTDHAIVLHKAQNGSNSDSSLHQSSSQPLLRVLNHENFIK